MFRKVANIIVFHSFFLLFLSWNESYVNLSVVGVSKSWIYSWDANRVFVICLIIINSLFFVVLIVKWRLQIKKMNLEEYKNLYTRYVQHKHTFLHKVFYKVILSTHSYLMVWVWTVKDARWKIKIRETLMSREWSAQAEVFLLL